MIYTEKDLTFVICAYAESPYLESCIRTLRRQSVKAKILIATSTPNLHIRTIARRYGLKLCVNTVKAGIASDWNFALSAADTPLVTIAHQDDLYHRDYAAEILIAANLAEDPILFFTDYGERRGTRSVAGNKLLRIKRIMLLPLRPRFAWKNRFIRRRVLSFGSPICCPSVTYVREKLPENLFEAFYRVSLDWAAWERLSRMEGSFVYVPEILMLHRIHRDSETTRQIGNSGRSTEDLKMYEKFWPKKIAQILEYFYHSSEDSNHI